MSGQVGFIFDMDGTMVDNMMVHHRAWQTKLASVGLNLTLDEVIAQCHGRNDEILTRLFGDRFSADERRQISQEKEAQYRLTVGGQLKLVDGLPEFLWTAFELGIPMGIGTAANIENVDFVLDTLNIRHFFGAILCERDVVKGKPDPEVFLKAADLLSVPAAQCLVFEDSPTGARAARNAGMNTVILTTTHQQPEFAEFDNVITLVPDYLSLQAGTLRDGVLEGTGI